MLFHDRQEVRESLGGGDLVRAARPGAAASGREDGVRRERATGRSWSPASSRGGGGFIPTADSTFQTGDYLAVIMAKDGMDLLDEVMIAAGRGAPLMRVVVTGAGAVGRHLASDLADRGHTVTLIDQDPDGRARRSQEWAPNVTVVQGDACEPWVLEEAELEAGRGRGRGDRRRRGQPGDVAARQAGVRRAPRPRPREPPEERVAVHRAVGRGRRRLPAAHPDRDGRGGRDRRRPRPADPAGGRAHLDRRDDAARSARRPSAARCTSCGCRPTPPSSRSSATATW